MLSVQKMLGHKSDIVSDKDNLGVKQFGKMMRNVPKCQVNRSFAYILKVF